MSGPYFSLLRTRATTQYFPAGISIRYNPLLSVFGEIKSAGLLVRALSYTNTSPPSTGFPPVSRTRPFRTKPAEASPCAGQQKRTARKNTIQDRENSPSHFLSSPPDLLPLPEVRFVPDYPDSRFFPAVQYRGERVVRSPPVLPGIHIFIVEIAESEIIVSVGKEVISPDGTVPLPSPGQRSRSRFGLSHYAK